METRRGWSVGNVVPITGLCLLLLSMPVLTRAVVGLMKQLADVGVSDLPNFILLGAQPLTFPITCFVVGGCFIVAILVKNERAKAALSAIGMASLVFYTLFWTTYVTFTACMAQMAEGMKRPAAVWSVNPSAGRE